LKISRFVALAAIAAALLSASYSSAATIISYTGPSGGSASMENGATTRAVSWIQSDPFANVSINAVISCAQGGTAYLTTQIGPGTSVANQIASAPFPSTPAFTDTNLFSGLTLPAGTYYLVINVNTAGGWDTTSSATTTTAPGVSGNGFYVNADTNAYPPAETYSANSIILLYSVTGTLVPEPSTAIAFLVGGGMLGALAWRKK
jgi:hypothetical protein